MMQDQFIYNAGHAQDILETLRRNRIAVVHGTEDEFIEATAEAVREGLDFRVFSTCGVNCGMWEPES